jgi:cytochrome c
MLEGALLVAALAVGDPKAGEAVYSRCLGCHALEYNRTGPKHCGLLGRRAGAADGYDYSPAMKKSKLLWSEETLDRFLADPLKTVPGTTMTYAGVSDAKERADLVAYLKEQSVSDRCTTKGK